MGQKDKARAIVTELYEFDAETNLDAPGVLRAADRAAASSESSLKGGIDLVDQHVRDPHDFDATFTLRGPGRVVKVMGFVITGRPTGHGTMQVSMRVGDFLFQKGSLGMKPSINGHKVIGAFVQVLESELAVGAVAAPPSEASVPAAATAPAAAETEAAAGRAAVAADPTAEEPTAPADWYPDPTGNARLRYWDGTQWTTHTAE